MIDLHGFAIHEAWAHFKDAVDDAYFRKKRTLTIITGRGAMEKEFPAWVLNHPRARWCEVVNPGCFRITLKKEPK